MSRSSDNRNTATKPSNRFGLLRAIKARDAEQASAIMREHMIEAEKYMLERAAVRERFPARP